MSSSKDVGKDMELKMSGGIHKIEQQLQHIASESQQRSFNIGAQLQDMTVLICSYVITLAYSVPGGHL